MIKWSKDPDLMNNINSNTAKYDWTKTKPEKILSLSVFMAIWTYGLINFQATRNDIVVLYCFDGALKTDQCVVLLFISRWRMDILCTKCDRQSFKASKSRIVDVIIFFCCPSIFDVIVLQFVTCSWLYFWFYVKLHYPLWGFRGLEVKFRHWKGGFIKHQWVISYEGFPS